MSRKHYERARRSHAICRQYRTVISGATAIENLEFEQLIESSGNKAYFVAIATLNRHRVASVKQTDFLEALPKMWNQIRSKGGNEDILCPILGSRFARLNLERTRLIHAIVRSFIAATREGKLTERLTIVIHPRDYRETSLCMEELARFIECECKYRSEPVLTDNAQPRGTMLE